MEIKRFFISPNDIFGSIIRICGEEYIHIVKVSRYKKGYKLIACDGSGKDYMCTIVDVTDDCVECEINDITDNVKEPQIDITLYQCNIDKMDIVVQKATELGVKKIVPVLSKFVNEKDVKIDRLRRIALEASKQCGRAYAVEIADAVTFIEAVKVAEAELKLMAYEREKVVTLKDVLCKNAKKIAILIGSEGGFSQEEVENAVSNGFKAFTLGARILRAETASIVSIGLIVNSLEGRI